MPDFNRLFIKMSKIWVNLLLISLFITSYFFIDQFLVHHLAPLSLGKELPWLNWFTALGTALIYLVLLIIAIFICRYIVINRYWEKRFIFLFLSVAIPYIICGLLKVTLGRARPLMWIENNLYGFYGFQTNSNFWSFPSGHSTAIMGLVIGLSVLFPRYFYQLILAGLLIASSRVLLLQHYLSDVMSASYLAFVEIGLLLAYLRKKQWLIGASDNQSLNKIE